MSAFINSERDLIEYFGSGGEAVSVGEWMDFWYSISPRDRLYYRTTPLF